MYHVYILLMALIILNMLLRLLVTCFIPITKLCFEVVVVCAFFIFVFLLVYNVVLILYSWCQSIVLN